MTPGRPRSAHRAAVSQAALPILRNTQLRKNVAHATDVIQAKRARLVAEKTRLAGTAHGCRSHQG